MLNYIFPIKLDGILAQQNIFKRWMIFRKETGQ